MRPGAERFVIEQVHNEDWDRIEPELMALEERAFEPARRHDLEFLRSHARSPRAVQVCALERGRVVGVCLAAPLERFTTVVGAREDGSMGRGDTLYSYDLALLPEVRGLGLAWALKRRQLQLAQSLGFHWLSGRVRLPEASAAFHVIKGLGPCTWTWYEGHYNDELGRSDMGYYRLKLG